MIGVIGATGNVGRPLVKALSEAGEEVIAISRRGGRAAPRVRHLEADLAKPAHLGELLHGARAVFVMVAGSGAELDARAIVGSAAEAGARHIVLLSSIGTRSRPSASSHEPLRAFEVEVKRCGLSWTILQPGGFASNALAWVASVRGERTIAAPFGDVAIPVVDPDDIAAVAAEALLREHRHAGRVYELTGPAAITPREQTNSLAAAIGSPLTFIALTRAQAAEVWRGFMPPAIVETTLDALGSPNELERRISPDVEQVLGRPARPFSAWAARHVDLFR